MKAWLARLRGLLAAATGIVLRLALALVVVEGTASLVGFVLALPHRADVPEREQMHLRYDPELGWVHVPDTRLIDYYGPDRHLTINDQGFRGSRNVGAPLDDRLRTVCAGDSFTLGTGVGDADTWCAQLESLEPRLETVNMGQGGYGVDQIFLWLRRDGVPLEPRLWLVALTRDDFGRMESDTFEHQGKPMLRIADTGALEIRNVPVPHAERETPWLLRHASLFESLRIVQLAQPAFDALVPRKRGRLSAGELTELSLRVFEELRGLAARQDAALVLVYLPTRDAEDAAGDLWRRRIVREARQRGFAFVDLVEEQRTLPPAAVPGLYIPRGAFGFPGADGHFNEVGNTWIAQSLREHLRRLPALALALDTPASS